MAIDVESNLLVYLESVTDDQAGIDGLVEPFIGLDPVRLHFRRLDSGDYHPNAARSVVQFGGWHPLIHDELYICGELVACISVNAECTDGILTVWNWNSGTLLGHLRQVFRGPTAAFVSPDTLLVSKYFSMSDCDLALYRVPEHTGGQLEALAELVLPDDQRVRSEPEPASHYGSPTVEISGSRAFASVRFHQSQSPAPGGSGDSIVGQGGHPFPFASSDDGTFIHVKIDFFITDGETSIGLYVPRSAVLRYAEPPSSPLNSPAGRAAAGPPRRIPWEEWGAPYERAATLPDPTHSRIFGSKQVSFSRNTHSIIVRDFVSKHLRGVLPQEKTLRRAALRRGVQWQYVMYEPAAAGEPKKEESVVIRELGSARRQKRWVDLIVGDEQHIVLFTYPFVTVQGTRQAELIILSF